MSWDFITNWLHSGQGWIAQVFLVVFGTALLNLLEIRIYKRLQNKLEKTKSIWDEALVSAFHKPLGILIWIVGLTYAIQITSSYAPDLRLFDFIPSIRQAGAVILITWCLLRFIQRVEQQYLMRGADGAIDVTSANALSQILRISILITGGLVILPIFDIKITGLVVFGSAGTLIAGLAAQDLLSNFFGALTIYLDRPFAVGDWIKSPDRELEGTVEYIGWRLTRIRTFDRQPLYVPNSVFSKIVVQNPSRMSNRRIKELVGIRYKDAAALSKITVQIKDMLMNHPEIDTTKVCFVNLVGFGPSSLELQVYTFTKTTAWIPYQEIKQDIMIKILDIIHQNGSEIALPTRTIEMGKDNLEESAKFADRA